MRQTGSRPGLTQRKSSLPTRSTSSWKTFSSESVNLASHSGIISVKKWHLSLYQSVRDYNKCCECYHQGKHRHRFLRPVHRLVPVNYVFVWFCEGMNSFQYLEKIVGGRLLDNNKDELCFLEVSKMSLENNNWKRWTTRTEIECKIKKRDGVNWFFQR